MPAIALPPRVCAWACVSSSAHARIAATTDDGIPHRALPVVASLAMHRRCESTRTSQASPSPATMCASACELHCAALPCASSAVRVPWPCWHTAVVRAWFCLTSPHLHMVGPLGAIPAMAMSPQPPPVHRDRPSLPPLPRRCMAAVPSSSAAAPPLLGRAKATIIPVHVRHAARVRGLHRQ